MRDAGRPIVCTLAAAAAAAIFAAAPAFADALLSGTIKSASGEPMGGVTVSAKADGGTITTTVFTDDGGRYYFPPLPNGNYRVWAQALSFATAKGTVALAANGHQDFTLAPLSGDYFRQLPGDLVMASLPEATSDDKRLKKLVENDCTGCHQPNYPLQHRFDKAGWGAILDLMKNVNVSGVYLGPDHKPQGVIDHNQAELAAYLARARGPGVSDGKIVLRPRPSGETARVVFKEYDVPLQADLDVPAKTPLTDGSDWLNGTPSRRGSLVHDAWADLDGDLWFTSNVPNHFTSIGHIDVKTGEVKMFKVPSSSGLAANTHGMTRDPNGIIWFNCNVGRGALCRLDPKTQKIATFLPPQGMSPTGGATTVDWDGQGKIWVSAPDGALRFDPVTEEFTEFKSHTYKTPNGMGLTYGAAGDRNGNGWWAEMIIDTIDKGDSATGKSIELKLPRVQLAEDAMTETDRAFYQLLRAARLQRAGAVEPGSAPHGYGQKRRRAVGRRFLGPQPRQDQHQHHADELRAAAEPGRAAALSHRGRSEPQRVAQHLDLRCGAALRPGRRQMDDIRLADPRH